MLRWRWPRLMPVRNRLHLDRWNRRLSSPLWLSHLIVAPNISCDAKRCQTLERQRAEDRGGQRTENGTKTCPRRVRRRVFTGTADVPLATRAKRAQSPFTSGLDDLNGGFCGNACSRCALIAGRTPAFPVKSWDPDLWPLPSVVRPLFLILRRCGDRFAAAIERRL